MQTMKWMLGFLLTCTLTARAQDVVIQSFDAGGKVTFNEVTNVKGYRVEWASAAGGTWTNFGLPQLDYIHATGSGIVTAAVPMLYRVVATEIPFGMVLIPAGSFVMGATTNVGHESYFGDTPQHTVNVSDFYLDKYEVSKALWDEVKAWGDTNGYFFDYPGSGKSATHPAHSMSWYDAVKWCNARSQKEGLIPVYYVNGDMNEVYVTGVYYPYANWSANGYRLSTEAEWEKAARGGVADTRFPWTDYTNKISHAKANYHGTSGSYGYDLSDGPHPAYNDDVYPYSSPVGSFAPNGYGVCDMAGNLREWVWDWYDEDYYSSSPDTNPRGPTSGTSRRVVRGGGWQVPAFFALCASRDESSAGGGTGDLGFRCARSF